MHSGFKLLVFHLLNIASMSTNPKHKNVINAT